MFIDTHTHIYLPEFNYDRGTVIYNAIQSGVDKMLLPNIDMDSVKDLFKISSAFTGKVYPMMGLHPGSVNENYISHLKKTENYLSYDCFKGIGEIGMDLYWDKSFKKQQEDAFLKQCSWAERLNLPVSIHSRNATSEILELLEKENKIPGGIFHCFTGDYIEANRIINLGLKLGIGGVITFKNSNLRNTIEKIAPQNIVLETDAPYLTPHPFRGNRNEPKYIRLIAEELARIYGLSTDDLALITSTTAKKLFKI